MCLWNTNAHDYVQFQRWSRTQGQINSRMLVCILKALLFFFVMHNHYLLKHVRMVLSLTFLKICQMLKSKGLVPTNCSVTKILLWDSKSLALAVQKLLASSIFSESKSKLQCQGHGVKMYWYPQKCLITKNTLVKY